MGRPTLPTALVFSPAAVNIDSSMPTVVVLPLVPVTASQGTCRSGRLIRQASSTSPHTGMPRSAASERNRERQRQLDRQRRASSLVKNNVALDLKHSAAEVWLVGPDAADLVKNNVAFSEVIVFQRVIRSPAESCKEQPPGPGSVLPV